MPLSLISKATHIIREGAPCWGPSGERKREASMDQVQCSSSEGELRSSGARRPEVRAGFLGCVHRTAATRGRGEGALAFTFCSYVPWHADSPLPITDIPSAICPSLLLQHFANEEADQKSWVGSMQLLMVRTEAQAGAPYTNSRAFYSSLPHTSKVT